MCTCASPGHCHVPICTCRCHIPVMSEIIFCYAKCWACNFGEHTQCAGTWADADDIDHAKATGADWQKIAAQPCGCYCHHLAQSDSTVQQNRSQ